MFLNNCLEMFPALLGVFCKRHARGRCWAKLRNIASTRRAGELPVGFGANGLTDIEIGYRIEGEQALS